MPSATVEQQAWTVLRTKLERRRRDLADAISSYPSPIAGCDAQFNALLEERNKVVQGLRRLDRLRSDPDADIASFEKEVQSSSNTD